MVGHDGDIVIRSFGLGVYSFSKVGGSPVLADEVASWCKDNGFGEPAVSIGPSGRAYVVCEFGQEPCRAELVQFQEELDDAKEALSKAGVGAAQRLSALEAALQSIEA